jgi:hypothetical protein
VEERIVISRVLIKKQPGRRWLKYAAGLSLLALTLGIAGSALAVHDLTFQLDGDTDATTTTNVGTNGPQNKDWDSLFNADGSKKTGAFNETATSSAFTAGTFIRDFGVKVTALDKCNTTNTTSTTFCTGDDTTFATGSKDTLDITPGWQCNHDNNVNSKIDIMNAYAAQYLDGSTPAHRIMYFGLDKNKDNGNNNVAFWFLRGGASCTSTAGSVAFTGKHQNGDVLVVSAFTGGGGVSNIDAYMWNNGCIDRPGNATACDGLSIGSGGDCKGASGGDSICATTNSGPSPITGNITTQWLTSDATLGVGHTVVPPDFFEGGVDLTTTFGSVGVAVPSCFSTFIADTRSSQSLTATLFDYASGQLGQCTTTLTTQQNSGGPLSIGTGTVSSGTDSATLTINGASSWAGKLDFYLCGPGVSSCDKHGVKVTTTNVSSADASHVYTSGSATLTSAGTYCWHAVFTPDVDSLAGGVTGKEDSGGASECFTVNPVTPTLTTSASCSASPCILGSTLRDVAYLTGTATEPGSGGPGGDTGLYKSIYLSAPSGLTPADSSITWTLYGPAANGSAQCVTTKTLSPNTATVSGDRPAPPPVSNTGYGPVTYITSAANDALGTYTFAAVYPGDGVNTNAAADVTCANGATDGEQVTVGSAASTTTTQKWLPQDSAHVTATGGATVAGYVVFQLFENTACTGSPVQTFGDTAATRINVDSSGNATTNNTIYYVDTNKQISWQATFTSTNGVASGSPAPCERSDIANLDDDITSP